VDRCEAPCGGIDRLLRRPRLRAWAKRKRKWGPTHSRCVCACVCVCLCVGCHVDPLTRDQRINFFPYLSVCVCVFPSYFATETYIHTCDVQLLLN
jgi:hypothetical protein